jgi:ribosomal protein S18 acetylase RimI-like enzyme
VTVRCPAASDRHVVHEALTRCGAFTDEEIRVAIEMFDSGLAGDYSLLGIETGGALRAYACFGKAGLTQRSWYLYWMCVHPDVQRSGLGQALERTVEDFVRQRDGDRLVLETSGRPDYERARRFYERAGFTMHGRIPDFYRPGDDCIIYCKLLDISQGQEHHK